MATTSNQSDSAIVAASANALAQLGGGDLPFTAEEQRQIFSSVAKGAKTPTDRLVYMRRCQAEGLSPWKNELFAITRKVRGRNGGDGFEVMSLVTSYHVFVSRCRKAGFLLGGSEVCEADEFMWDAAHYKPVRHHVNPSDRGKIVGAWAEATHLASGRSTGKFWPVNELGNFAANPVLGSMLGHAAFKTAVCRIARLVTPDLSSLYAAEEYGVAVFAGESLSELPPGMPADPVEQIADQTAAQAAEDESQAPAIEAEAYSQDAPAIARKQVVMVLRSLSKIEVIKSGDITKKLAEWVGRDLDSVQDLTATEFEKLVAEGKVDG